MDIITDPSELARRLRVLAFTGGLPPEIDTRVQSIGGVQADFLVEGAELLFAFYDKLADPARELTGQLFAYAVESNWTGFNKGERGTNNRSEQIVALVRRDLGEKGANVAAKSAEYPEPQANRREGVDWRTAKADS